MQGRLRPGGGTDFAKDVAQMNFDRVGTDRELLRNLFIACARGDQPQNLAFAVTQFGLFLGGLTFLKRGHWIDYKIHLESRTIGR